MSDPPMLPSALGIEAVEWLATADNMTVRVRGRWRRRPTWTGQPLLVIETRGRRHRFPAMPEPPGITGAAPGTWQLTFTLPLTLAPRGEARAWLQLGAVNVPLPVPVEEAGPRDAGPSLATEMPVPAERAEPATLAERRVRGAELAAEAAARRATEADERLHELEQEIARLKGALAEAEREPERLRADVAERGRRLRRAEQLAHSERALRIEVEAELAARTHTSRWFEDVAALERRARELESEIARLQRALAEAENAAAAALVERDLARAASERQAAPRAPQRAESIAAGVRAETELARESGSAQAAMPAVALVPADAGRLEREQELVHARARAELRVAALERELLTQRRRSERVYEAIAGLRAEIEQLRGARPPAPVVPEPPPADIPGPAAPQRPVEPERFGEALARLRAATPAPAAPAPPAPAPPAPAPEEPIPAPEEVVPAPDALRSGPPTAWLERALRRLAREDGDAAAFVLDALLPGIASGPAVRLLAARGPRRLLRRLRSRARASEIRALLAAAHSFAELRIPPRPVFLLAAAMIDPAWTAGEQFTLAYDGGPYLYVRDGAEVRVGTVAPLGRAAATIDCAPEDLPAVLAGPLPPGAEVVGEARALALVRGWLERAQSG